MLTLKPQPSANNGIDALCEKHSDSMKKNKAKVSDGNSVNSQRTCNTAESRQSVNSISVGTSHTVTLQSPRPDLEAQVCKRKIPPPAKSKSKTEAATAAVVADFTLDLSLAPLRNKRLIRGR